MNNNRKSRVRNLTKPVMRFIKEEKSGALVLGVCVIVAMILANSAWSAHYFKVLDFKFGFSFNDHTYFENNILHWINDGLMSLFFFIVGLELKRELVAGELANPKKALLPIIAAIGGMVVPASIYLLFNHSNAEVHAGWGIPMATDIAFALGVLYLLGDKVPLSLKVFLAALAIVDDLGAVMVIALFYTSDLSLMNLVVGFVLLTVMFMGNRLGIRNVFFYALLGIGGVWVSFLMSGVHATIAAVLAAFTIPSDIVINESVYIRKVRMLLRSISASDPGNQQKALTQAQVQLFQEVAQVSKASIPPLQRLEHIMHPYVSFLVIPIFALANAGVSLRDIDMTQLTETNIAMGVGLGLLVGKVIGVFGFTWLAAKLKIAILPDTMTPRRLLGLGFLAAIGFTMSLFVTSLAFNHELYMTQAKVGVFVASIIGGVIGYLILNADAKKTTNGV